MTPRERMQAAITRAPVDRVPFSTYNCHPFAGSRHAADPAYRPVIDAIRRTRAGCLCKTRPVRTIEAVPSRVREVRDGSATVTTTTVETPAGALTSILRKPDGQPAMRVKHLVGDDRDLARYLSIPYERPQWDLQPVFDMRRAVGVKGMEYVRYDDPFSEVAELFGQEDFMIRIADDIESIARLHDFVFERVLEDLRLLLDAVGNDGAPLLFYTDGPERATPPLLPPRIFARFVVPYEKRLVELIHSRGHRASLHCHGRVRAVLPLILECGFDLLEPIEPPPQGDIGLAELLERCDGRLALFGHIQDQDLHILDEGGVRETVRRLAAVASGRSGFILGPTCTPFAFPPTDRFIANYAAFLEEADRAL